MLATEVFQFRYMDNIIYSYLQSLLDSDSLMGGAQATVVPTHPSVKTMPELRGSTFMPFTIQLILKCHIGKYREAASMLQLWKPPSHPFCTSWGGVTEYHRVYLFQPKSNNPTHVSQRLAGCVGERFWHFSCVQTSTTILIASSTDWLKMCAIIIIFK